MTNATALDFTGIAAQTFGDESLDVLHHVVRVTDGTWRAARSQGVDPELLRDLVQAYIDASYAFQRRRWGKVKVKMSVSVLLRLSL